MSLTAHTGITIFRTTIDAQGNIFEPGEAVPMDGEGFLLDALRAENS